MVDGVRWDASRAIRRNERGNSRSRDIVLTVSSRGVVRARLKRLIGRRGVAGVRHARRIFRARGLGLLEGGRTHPALLVPASSEWGFDRGTTVDRHHIEDFLESHAGDGQEPGDVRGHVLEFGGQEYSRRFGPSSKAAKQGAIERIDVMDIDPANPNATIIGDLVDPERLQAETFDCVICTEADADLRRSRRRRKFASFTAAGWGLADHRRRDQPDLQA